MIQYESPTHIQQTHACTHTHTYKHTHACTHAHNIRTRTNTHATTHIHMHATSILTLTLKHTRNNTCTYARDIHTNSHAHDCTYNHTLRCPLEEAPQWGTSTNCCKKKVKVTDTVGEVPLTIAHTITHIWSHFCARVHALCVCVRAWAGILSLRKYVVVQNVLSVTNKHTNKHIYIYMYTYVYIYVCIYTRTCMHI